jgi:hypothetical protein
MSNHVIHYIPLVLILLLGLGGVTLYQYDTNIQRALIVATAAGYVIWGVIHHKLHEELSFEIFLEYLFVAIIGCILAFTVV